MNAYEFFASLGLPLLQFHARVTSSVFSRKMRHVDLPDARTGLGTPLNQRTGRRQTYRSSIWRSATFSERMPPPMGVVSGPLMRDEVLAEGRRPSPAGSQVLRSLFDAFSPA